MYTKYDLESITGVTFRTIREWIRYQLVPRPSPPMGRNAAYSEAHVQAVLRAKRDLIDGRMTRADWRDRYNPEPDDE